MDIKRLLRTDLRTFFGMPMPPGKDGAPGKPRGGKPWRGPTYLGWAHLRQSDRITVLGQLAAIVRVNASLVHGLQVAAVDAPSTRLENILLSLRDDLASGMPLWESMAKLRKVFPRYQSELVRIAEESGQLPSVLAELAEEDSRYATLSRSLTAWFGGYLPFMLLIPLFIASFMGAYIVPQFSEVMCEFDAPLPWQMRILYALGEWLAPEAPPDALPGAARTVSTNAELLFAGCVLLFVVLSFELTTLGAPNPTYRRGRLRTAFQRLAAWLPGTQSFVRRTSLARMSEAMHRLLEAGVPLDDALELAAEAGINPYYRDMLIRARDRVRQGFSLTDSFGQEPWAPKALISLVSIGENAGLVPRSFQRLGSFYRRLALRQLRMCESWLVPVCVLIAGSATLFITSAFFSFYVSLSNGLANAV